MQCEDFMKHNYRTIFPLSAVAILLAGCTNPAQFDDMNSYEKTKQGAVIGGVLGAMGGLLTGNGDNKNERAIKGAILGSGAGALIGNQLDKQEADLRRTMGNENVMIQNTGDRLIVTLPQDILFAVDSTDLRGDLLQDLQALAQNLLAYPNTNVRVIGHTDNTGAASYNQSLSVARANSVGSVLVRNGVNPERIIAIGRGEDEPVASNLTPSGRTQNRRVEIVILPLVGN